MIPTGGVYFFNKVQILDQFISYCNPMAIYSNLDRHRYNDKTMYYESSTEAAMKMLTNLYNEMHTETYEYIENQIQEHHHLPLKEFHEKIDPLARLLPGNKFRFTMSRVRPQMEDSSNFLLIMKIQLSHLKNQKLSTLLSELLHNSYEYNLTIFLISYIPFNWIPSLIVKAVTHFVYNSQNPYDQLTNYFSFMDKTYLETNYYRMESNDFLVLKRIKNGYSYRFFPYPRGEKSIQDHFDEIAYLETDETVPTIHL